MLWRTLVAGMLGVAGVAAQAHALSLDSVSVTSGDQSPGAVVQAAAPPAPTDFIVPPHLPGGLPGPPGWNPDQQGLPTFQDLVGASPTYVAPPPMRPRVR